LNQQESQTIMLRNAALSLYRTERDALLKRVVALLETDPRVRAAYLFGSLGRGEDDDLSDLDLYVVLEDAAVATLRGNAVEQVAMIAPVGSLLAHLGGPQNAPPKGAYRMALYDGEWGPHLIDWYFLGETERRQEETLASDTRILLDRMGLMEKTRRPERLLFPPPSNLPNPEDAYFSPSGRSAEEGRNRIAGFWAMWMISAKYIARQGDDQELFLGGLLRDLLRGIAELGTIEEFVEETGAFPRTTIEKIAYLRHLAERAEELLRVLAAKAIPGVSFALIASCQRYLSLITAITANL